jgi:glutaredoxin 3
MAETDKNIIIYSTTWCGYCKMVKKYLADKGYTYEEKDIEANLEARNELLEKIDGQFQGVPVIDIGGKLVLGFNRPAIDEALA